MAKQKATDTGADTPEVKKEDGFDQMIRKMIESMAVATSSDMNEYQIQASILTRLAKWSKKRTGVEDNVMCADWEEKYLPKYVTLVAQVSRAQHQKVLKYMSTKQKDARKEFQDAALIVPIGSVN